MNWIFRKLLDLVISCFRLATPMVFTLTKYGMLVRLLLEIFGWMKTKIQNINTVHVIDMIVNAEIASIFARFNSRRKRNR